MALIGTASAAPGPVPSALPMPMAMPVPIAAAASAALLMEGLAALPEVMGGWIADPRWQTPGPAEAVGGTGESPGPAPALPWGFTLLRAIRGSALVAVPAGGG
jgi:hypothetical protein